MSVVTREAGPAAPPVRGSREQSPAGSAARRAGGQGVLAAAWCAAVGAGVAVLLGAAAVGGAAAPQALADPGAFVRYGLLLVRVAQDVAAMGTLGALLVGVVLLSPAAGDLGPDAARLVRLAARWAAVWSLSALAATVLALADTVGIGVTTVLAPDVLPLALELPSTRATLSSAWLAALVVGFSRWTRSPAGGRMLLLTGVAALLPPVLSGHAGHGDDHAVAVTALAVHVLAASLWVGGLVALALHLRRSSAALAVALPRYSRVALGCCVAVSLTGASAGWSALAGADALWTTPYGRLLAAKVAALVVLAGAGYLHRRRTVAAAAGGRPRALLAVAVVELVLMAGTAGLAVGLSATAPPQTDDHAVAAALADGSEPGA